MCKLQGNDIDFWDLQMFIWKIIPELSVLCRYYYFIFNHNS